MDHALRLAISGREEELGLTLVPRKSRRIHPIMVTDLDYADDIALISDTAEKGRALLLEKECRKIGLKLNVKKTKVMSVNTRTKPLLQTGQNWSQSRTSSTSGPGLHQLNRI